VREPSLETALAFETIFQKPVSELFGGLYQKVQAEVAIRTKTLTHKTGRGKSNRQTALRHQMFADIASKSLNQP
jgi:hypothetical protein